MGELPIRRFGAVNIVFQSKPVEKSKLSLLRKLTFSLKPKSHDPVQLHADAKEIYAEFKRNVVCSPHRSPECVSYHIGDSIFRYPPPKSKSCSRGFKKTTS